MPDERQDSIQQGIHAPAESPSGTEAAEENRRRAADSPPIGGAMGGTSDASRPGDESQMNAAQHAASDQDEEDASIRQQAD